ncbi:hypothetical protein SDC9_181539 [bioreactor metagenome]|uniref:Uncharacterized protein n=1 Tax=bioreactor metagenome TaxID=1076179 RepID=A0A645H4V3_9ZZZZ
MPAARPSALTTNGALRFARAALHSSRSVQRSKSEVGMPCLFMNCLEKALLPSRRAPEAPGPMTRMPAARSASAVPATRGASGPMKTSSMPSSRQSPTMACGSQGSPAWQRASFAIPGLPGQQCSPPVIFDWENAWTTACSLPPPPNTITFILGAPNA